MSESVIDFDSVEAADSTNTIGWADVEEFNGEVYGSDLLVEGLKHVEEKADGSTSVDVDFVHGGRDNPVIAFKPRHHEKAMVVAPKIRANLRNDLESSGLNDEIETELAKDLVSNTRHDLVKRRNQVRGLKDDSNRMPYDGLTYLEGYLDALEMGIGAFESLEGMLE